LVAAGLGHGRSRRQRLSGLGFLLEGGRSARRSESILCEIGGRGQSVDRDSVRRFSGGARLQKRAMWRGVSGRAGRSDVRRRRNSLRALERGQRAPGAAAYLLLFVDQRRRKLVAAR